MTFKLTACLATAIAIANIGIARAQLPSGFVYLGEVDPTIKQDIRYAGSHNFIGRPVRGYQAAECVLTEQAARALAAVQKELAPRNLSLVMWDCYRPARAVADFARHRERHVPRSAAADAARAHRDRARQTPVS